MDQLLNKTDLKRISDKHPDGLSSQEIVDIFQARGIRFSEATFRKYVQMGLVERCKRVGRKGKHRGSHGLYPISTVARINSIKKMISGDLTLEQLRGSYFSMRQRMEEAERIIQEVREEMKKQKDSKGKKERQDVLLTREMETLQKNAQRVTTMLQKLENTYLG